MDQETVNPEAEVEVSSEAYAEQPQEAYVEAQEEVTQVPLHALQTERRKRQEAEMRAKILEEQYSKRVEEPEDDTRYESATKEDLGKAKTALKREIQEENWVRENPDRYRRINEELAEFLKLRPNLASAIEGSTNRYEEAWTLMNALSPKQQQQIVQKTKPQAPGSPSGVPKAAAMSANVDLMNMSDAEFNSWRQQRRGQR